MAAIATRFAAFVVRRDRSSRTRTSDSATGVLLDQGLAKVGGLLLGGGPRLALACEICQYLSAKIVAQGHDIL